MSTKTCAEIALNTAVYGSVNIVVNTAVAWGTKFVTQIPTQALLPAAIIGTIHSLSYIISIKFIEKYEHQFPKYSLESSSTFELQCLSFASLTTIIIAPTLCTFIGRTITYKGAASFAVLSSVTTEYFNKLLRHILPSCS